MTHKRHLILKNEIGISRIFKRSRGVEKEDETDADKDFSFQKQRLNSDLSTFIRDRTIRNNSRDAALSVPHFDAVAIDFLKIVDAGLAKSLKNKFGLSPLSFSNFNQTVCFAIADAERFRQNFENGLRAFVESLDNNICSEWKILTTIQNFRFVTASVIARDVPLNTLKENIVLEFYEDNISTSDSQRKIQSALNDYLDRKGISISEISDTIFQIDNIPQNDLKYILDNFDIIQSVQGLRYLRMMPNEFGEPKPAIGLTLRLEPNAPTIGILDTGIADNPVLRPILCDDGIDVTSTLNHPYEVLCDHGTTVACLASFGNSFFNNSDYNLTADAKVFSIKIQEGEEGCINLKGIKDAIIRANQEFGIRIFNLSMSGGSKNYNSDISTYAFLLDKLSYDLDILIFISAGNLPTEDIREMVNIWMDSSTSTEIRTFLQFPNHFYNPYIDLEDTTVYDCECINLSEPAESMNNITVGAIADNLSGKDKEHKGLSLGKQFPAFYTRKFYIDYSGKINNTGFKKNQINRNIFKPDIVMPGGDVLDKDAGMQVIGINCGQLDYIKSVGTSYAAPLAANLASKILRIYPNLRSQTIKALLINSSQEIDPRYLNDCIENLKWKENHSYPNVDQSEKTKLSKLYKAEHLSHNISGHGTPDIEKCLYSDDKRVTFIIEDDILFDSHKVINLNLPTYLNNHPNKTKALRLTATLCYSFNPVYGNAMSYLPLHISFNIGNSMNHDDSFANAEEYSTHTKKSDNDRMSIKGSLTPWSDDFYPANTKRFSNVQKMGMNITGKELDKVSNQIAVIFRCTGRDDDRFVSLRNQNHKFSFVLTIEELPAKTLDNFSLYDEISLCNTVEAVAELDTEAALEADI